MCGILAHFKTSPLTQTDYDNALKSLSSIDHRGPDGEGLCVINTATGAHKFIRTDKSLGIGEELSSINLEEFNLIFGHKRLSIFDLSAAGSQPMLCKRTSNILLFNGEIYNWFEIREELKQKGYSFQTQSDSEVILAAYDYWGADCLTHFNGMWAIVIYDKAKQSIFASRDRYAVKPLFYSQTNEQIIFSSEIKQYLFYKKSVGGYNKHLINYFLEEGLINFNSETFFNNVFRFPNASCSYISSTNFNLQFKKYYTLKAEPTKLSYTEAIEKFTYLLNDAVKIRLRADVPVGVAVSGGLDSSAIFALAYEQLKQSNKQHLLNTFSVISPNEEGDESQHINALLDGYNCLKHTVSPLSEFSVEDLKTHLYYHDFPTITSSFYADFCLSRLTAQHGVKVLLNGQGADEVFAGYHHHFYKYAATLLKQLKFNQYKEEVNAFSYLKSFNPEKAKSAINSELKLWLKQKIGFQVKDEYGVKKAWLNAKNLNEQMRIDLLETMIPNYLASNDRNTMTFGIESRHPFMDYRLIEFGFSLPDSFKIKNGFQKIIIRDAMKGLPESIRWRKDKMGFTSPEGKILNLLNKSEAINRSALEDIGLKFKNDFRYYSLAIWLETYKL
jgi:asparagine synthase (glutamine-hydrolysing)